ncbi:daf-12-interacting protein 1-like [Melanotaenia boesemani]|uniref:daf-12-interacting protein 1-like n=1 Tax=Melanotaenia boesemani TaxID=1250792 RepID=UPI001C051B6F|nr:daf-12-interacting protein 1-like [Melanotaenia boesemani]XP_041828192.1 daf-12-interacting protein 1-like [Melanotaenia boesemani]
MGKPLSRPGCFRKSSCCLEKHGIGDGGVGGRDMGVEGGYGDGYVPQRSIYDTMCINQQIDSHHHHSGGSVRRDGGGEGSFYSASGSLRVSRSPADMFDPQPRSLTPNPSFVRRLDERAIYDSLKIAGQDGEGGGCHSPGCFNRSVSPSVSSFSAPGVSSSSAKKHHHHHHHHHGDSTKNRDSRQSWKVLTPPKHMECLELTTAEMMDRGGGYLNPGHYPPGGQSSSLTSPLISPFSGSPLSSGYHTPVFFSPAKPRPSQSQSLRCSPPQVIQPRHYSQTQSLRMSPPHELRRSPYRAPLVQLSAHDLEHDLRERGGGWGRNERDRDWEREREREMERGWAQREWERERERGRLERERARERERRETSTFGTFGYGQPVPLRSDSVFLESEQGLDTAPLLLPQPSPSPSPNAAPRMGTGAVGRNRAGSKVGPEVVCGGMVTKFDNGSVSLMLVDSKSGHGPRLVSETITGNLSEAEIRAGMHEHHRVESWNKSDNRSRASVKNMSEKRVGSQVKTRPGGRDLEGKVQSGLEIKERHRVEAKNGEKTGWVMTQPEPATKEVPFNRSDTEKMTRLVDKAQPEPASGLGMKPEPDVGFEVKAGSQQVEKKMEMVTEVKAKVNNEVSAAPETRIEAKAETDIKAAPKSKPEAEPEARGGEETVKESSSEAKNDSKTTDKAQTCSGEKTEAPSVDKAEKKPVEVEKSTGKSSRSKSKSSKSCSRTRPGTATGLRPGALSPRQNKGLGDFELTGPPEGIESTWPRRIMVRKRTVRQGGALHNLPILPPLPSVLSALEKRRPHPRPGSENPLSSVMNTGRCSLREPSHPEPAQGSSLVGRASLREQNLEHWRVYKENEEPRRSRSREKQGEKAREKTEKEERKENEEKREEKVEKEKEKVSVDMELSEEAKQATTEKRTEEKLQETSSRKREEKKERDVEITFKEEEDGGMKTEVVIQEQQGHDLVEVVAKLHQEEGEVEGGEGVTLGEEGGVESWDAVLDMVNTLWDDSWEKRGAGGGGGGGDADSFSGSLQRWPLLRPPVGFGGSHPPSSAASELSLTELERRARELDSDLEHLDLSQPHRENQESYQNLLEPQRERADMYQTHPGPQRDKAALLTGVSSRSQVSLELSVMASPATDPDRSPADWSAKSAGTSTVGTSSTKEDSSPDSNLTLESDSSGVFLSLSNQSQEDAGSDSDQPISGSELGSSNTSLEKDGEDGGLKEWGREESTELQWCYPSVLSTLSHEEVDGDGEGEESGCGGMGEDETGMDKTPLENTDISVPQSEETPPRKKVTLMGVDSPLPLSPSKQPIKHLLDPIQKPIRSSGLDCGDLDPFVQSDSFVYLAVSARPATMGEAPAVKEILHHDTKQDAQRHAGSKKVHVDLPNMEQDTKLMHLTTQKPEEGDFLCTDSFVYLAAPACLLLGPAGTTPYSGKESDSESSGSGPVDVSVLGCGSVAGDSDWDSDLSDSDPSRSSRILAAGNKPAGVARPKRPPTEPDWDLYEEATEPEMLEELQDEHDRREITEVTTGVEAEEEAASAVPMATPSVTTAAQPATSAEQSTTKKVTWQFKPAQRSVCTGSRKEKEKESLALGTFTEPGGGDTFRPSPSSSSSSSSSPSSSSSG